MTDRDRANERCSIDEAHDVLSDHHRRLVLRYLRATSDGVASREELLGYVNARSSDRYDAEATELRLHHVVLPGLEDAGLVERDPRSETIRYRPDSSVASLLDVGEEMYVPGQGTG